MGLLDTDDGNVQQEGCKGQEKEWNQPEPLRVCMQSAYMSNISPWFINKIKCPLQTWCSQT